MKRKLILPFFLIIILIFGSCGVPSEKNEEISTAEYISDEAAASSESASEENSLQSEESAFLPSDEVQESDMFTKRDSDTTYSSQIVNISLSGSTASASSDAVRISDGKIIISEEATYVFSGKLSDGMIYVDADENAKIQIVLNNASITSSSCAALYVLSCDKVFVTLPDGTENFLINGGSFEAIDDNNIDGAVFSKQDLTFNGKGKLAVTAPSSHAVVCKDDLVFTGGAYVIESASHGLDVNDSVRVKSSVFEIAAGKDGIHCENEDNPELGFIYIESGDFDISAEGDGISAGTAIDILGGSFNIITGGGSENAESKTSSDWGGFMGGKGPYGGKGPSGGKDSMGMPPGVPQGAVNDASAEDSESIKGIKASGEINISGGVFTVDSADDAVHSNLNITVSGGAFGIMTGDDGFHADETLTVCGGEIKISESYEGLEGLHIKISDGSISLYASDDGLNAAGGTDSSGTGGFRGGDMFGGPMSSGNGSIIISGGAVFINASGDGIDANGTLEITGGQITVTGPVQGDTATLDYDKSAVISGGTFIGTGASGMAQTFSDAKQGLISVSVGNRSAGTKIVLEDKDGNKLVEYTPELSFAVVIISAPELISGADYNLIIGEDSSSVNCR